MCVSSDKPNGNIFFTTSNASHHKQVTAFVWQGLDMLLLQDRATKPETLSFTILREDLPSPSGLVQGFKGRISMSSRTKINPLINRLTRLSELGGVTYFTPYSYLTFHDPLWL